jgi:pimeloyl-ACP methyl ester carboxylesterase
MTLYFLSGLGADSRAFKYLTFPANTKTVFIDWLTPNKDESLSEYAKRISQCIDTSGPFILIGMSFGGILATEIIEFVQPQKTILISSVTRRQELPFYYRLAGFLKANKLLPAKATNRSNALTYWMFGITSRNDKSLLNEILISTDTHFSKWAIHEILNWKRKASPGHLIRIHGDKDRVLPIINFKPTYLLKGAGHFMIANRAVEISKILEMEIGFSE